MGKADTGNKSFVLQSLLQHISFWLDRYLYTPNDSQEILVQKKIWWFINSLGLPMLFLMSYLLGNSEGKIIVGINIFFALAMIGSLFVFHFHKRDIENFALFTQLTIIILTSLKVFLMGGIIHGGGAVFVGLLGPLYALVLPSKKRSVIIFLFYLLLMIIASFVQPESSDRNILYYYFLGFSLSAIMAFSMLFYYTNRLEKLKNEEKRRMAELDEMKTNFYTAIAHELRTPLTLILGKSGQMKKVLKGFEEDFEMIERNGRNLLNLSQQILDLSKLEAKQLPIHLQQQDLVVYIKYLLESFHPITTAKGMNIIFNAVPGTLYMDFDEDKVRMILSNLISNAIKFSEPDTDIEVYLSLECAELEQVKIKVTDHGIGIPADHVSRVFDRYFQVEQHRVRHEEGSGLGLALTWELVKLLGGKITLQSEVNIGSSFSFWLPVTRKAIIKQPLFDLEPFADEEEITLETGVPVFKHVERLKLLLVEDNSDVISYMKSVLTQYEIYTAENGKTGFEYAIDLIPDLVISDVMMPLEDGFSLCKRLKEDLRTSHIPVILLTARADQSSRLVGLDAGADAYLEKPFDPEELELRIRKLTALRKTLQKRYSGMVFGFPLSLPKNPAYIKEDRFMEKFVQSIDNHMVDEEFGIDTLCNDLAMSRSKLYRKFSALTNLTVHQFIRKFKLNRSQHLLRTTNLNVSEVAFHTGFKNLSHFSRIYTEEFGFSPQKEKKDKAGIPTQ